VLAKIESCESLQNLEEIIRVSDGAMVARGDLGAQIPLEQVPSVQQDVVQLCRQLNKPVIVASQLLDSMIEYPTPTRAEVHHFLFFFLPLLLFFVYLSQYCYLSAISAISVISAISDISINSSHLSNLSCLSWELRESSYLGISMIGSRCFRDGATGG
jgi:hypothetical protein